MPALTRAVACLLASTVVVGAACSGGSNDDGVSRPAYIARADQVCGELREQVNALPFNSEDPAQVAHAFREGARLGDEQVRRLRIIEVPEGDADEIAAILDLAERLNDVGREAADAIIAKNDVRYRELIRESRDINRRQRELALDYGFRTCAGRP